MFELELVRSDIAPPSGDLDFHRERRGFVRRREQNMIGIVTDNAILPREDVARGAHALTAQTKRENGRFPFYQA